jgi:hypothetical protein
VNRPRWDRLLCWIGCHDWRNMDGKCTRCGFDDPWWDDFDPFKFA